MVSKMVYGPVLHAARLMKFLSVRNGVPDARTASGPQKKGWALPDEPKLQAKKKIKITVRLQARKRVGPPEKFFLYIYHHPQPPAKCIG